MCTGIDRAFGKLLDSLEKLNLDDNTLVVFTSDHGDMLGSHGCPKPKRPIHDTSSRVPMLMRQTGKLSPGKTSDLLFSTLDLMPTLLGLLDLDAPPGLHGQNLAQSIRDGRDDAVESITMLMISWPVFRGVITREWSFAMGPPDRPGNAFNQVLFNRRDDPHQQRNLFGHPECQPVQRELERLTRQWMDRFEDPFITIPQLARASAAKPLPRTPRQPGAVVTRHRLVSRPYQLTRELICYFKFHKLLESHLHVLPKYQDTLARCIAVAFTFDHALRIGGSCRG